MNENQLQQAVRLTQALGEMTVGRGKTLSDELRLGQSISLWEVVASYLTLYRFPLLFSNLAIKHAWRERFKYWLRPYRGLSARLRDLVVFPPKTPAACAKWPESGTTILCLGFVPTFYRDVLRPVAEALAKKERLQVVVIEENGNLLTTVSAAGDVQYQSIWNHWDAYTDDLSRGMLKQLKTLQKIFFQSELIEGLKDIGENVNSYGLIREFKWLFWREFKRLIYLAAVAGHILEQHRPALIISADDADQRCRIYSLLAGEMGIPALLVQQGLSDKEYPEWRFFSQTAVAAMGTVSRNAMIEQGVASEKITLTGHPGFDHLTIPQPDLCACIRTDLGVRDGWKMILFASQPYYHGVFNTPDIRREMIRGIIHACSSLKNTRLVVKPHPGDDVNELKSLIGKSSQAVLLDRTVDIIPLVKSCDVVVTFFSTVALQALYVGRPVVNVDFPGSGGHCFYKKSGATWVARSLDEIESNIRILTSKNRDEAMVSRESARKKFLFETAYLADGKATERVVEMALNMIRT
jgi:hypothetical protein